MKELTSKLLAVQVELRAPKGQFNKFGGYKYRSCEDILEAVKPILGRHGLLLTISDKVISVGARIYIEATATITDGIHSVSVSAIARESETKKGMDDSQITGSTSSYARKYALNGLFCIDDTKDSDATNDHSDKPAKKATYPQERFEASFPSWEAQIISGQKTAQEIIDFLDSKGANLSDGQKQTIMGV